MQGERGPAGAAHLGKALHLVLRNVKLLQAVKLKELNGLLCAAGAEQRVSAGTGRGTGGLQAESRPAHQTCNAAVCGAQLKARQVVQASEFLNAGR